jgi:hypothetical protein
VRIAPGLDPSLGLKEEAIQAARQWRFRPGAICGSTVPGQAVQLARRLGDRL